MVNPLREALDQLIASFAGALSFEFDASRPAELEVERAISDASLVAGVVACLQPLPAADLIVLAPLYVKLTLHIGRIKGFEISRERAGEIVREVLGAAWLALTSQALIGVVGKAIPFARPLLTYPLNYGATWALGHAVASYFDALREGRTPSAEDLREVFASQLAEGRRRGLERDPRRQEERAAALRERIARRDPSLATRTRLEFTTSLRPDRAAAPSSPGPARIVVRPRTAPDPAAPSEGPGPADSRASSAAAAALLIDRLERLAQLHAAGHLGAEEFKAAKARLLRPTEPGAPSDAGRSTETL